MELLQFEVTNAGTLGSRWTPPAPETKKASSLPGAALAALLQEEDDEDDWGGDAPDMSAEFARLGHLNEEADTDALPLTADFAPLPDGSLALVRWPRLARPAVVPDTVEGRTVTAIAATAFAASHLDESCFAQFGQSPISFSIFCMRMGRAVTTETLDEGGPTSVILPDSITHIGPYAFYHCTNLTSITLPDAISALPAGVFGDCSRLTSVHLPEQLQALGYLPRPTDQVMPDVGTFAGCHALKQLTLPPQLKMLGAHSFNSSGLATLTARDAGVKIGAVLSLWLRLHLTTLPHCSGWKRPMFLAMWWRGWVYPWPGIKFWQAMPNSEPSCGYRCCSSPSRFPTLTNWPRTRSGWISRPVWRWLGWKPLQGFPPPTASGIVQFWCSISTELHSSCPARLNRLTQSCSASSAAQTCSPHLMSALCFGWPEHSPFPPNSSAR